MLDIKKQINRLYSSSVFAQISLSGAWVAILSARGFSLAQIGFAETIFHIVSILFEIPSGVLADVFGRKKTLIISCLMRMLGNLIMVFSNNYVLVCISIAIQALNYNFSSGSGDALAFDSLKSVGQEDRFEKYASNQMIIYRVCEGASTLTAGLALILGYRIAYSSSVFFAVIQLVLLAGLVEVRTEPCTKETNLAQTQEPVMQTTLAPNQAPVTQSNLAQSSFEQNSSATSNPKSIPRQIQLCFRESFLFLRKSRRALVMMFANSFAGAMDILLLFFLQAKLPMAGIPKWALGISLLVMQVGGIIGSRLILRVHNIRYRTIFALASVAILFGIAMEHTGLYPLMTLGGFAASMADDALQVRTNALLQDIFPSEQRATLISVDSFTFSCVMIVLSPLAGMFFSWW